jgi:hypothetical protein
MLYYRYILLLFIGMLLIKSDKLNKKSIPEVLPNNLTIYYSQPKYPGCEKKAAKSQPVSLIENDISKSKELIFTQNYIITIN